MDEHLLSVKEARKLTGKSESTIKRLIREITGDPDHPDRSLVLPSRDEVEKRRAAGDTYTWRIDTKLLLSRYPQESDSEQGSENVEKATTTAGSNGGIIDLLREQLQSKDQQLRTLETQLDRKDDQIAKLNDRMRESNVLMQELQKRLAIGPPVDQVQNTPASTKIDTRVRRSARVPSDKPRSYEMPTFTRILSGTK